MFKNYNHLGFNNPYYTKKDSKLIISKSFTKILEQKTDVEIDLLAAIQVVNKGYMFADRTIIQEVYKTPWLAKPNQDFTDWEFTQAPKHDKIDVDEKSIAEILFKKICKEIRLYIGDSKDVGVLLSGGMDSRMVAGALDFLIKKGELEDIKITGLTWGNENSRDVVYAQEIAKRLDWNWKHYTVKAKDIIANVYETAKEGCQYSPIHLHAIPQIRDDNSLDIILGGSYGDSIGRAEYQGRNVENLKSLLNDLKNISYIFNEAGFDEKFREYESDILKYHKLFPEEEEYMQSELDYQIHYMRRCLNPCMDLFTSKMHFSQAFTHPEVFGYMWSLKPSKRNDLVYHYMLDEFSTNLKDIPWARTGLAFFVENGTPDSYSKQHHSYVDIFHKEVLKELKPILLSKELESLGIFNQGNIKVLIFLLDKFPANNIFYVDKVLWLSSVAIMAKSYGFAKKENKLSTEKTRYLKVIFGYFGTIIKHKLISVAKKYKML